MHAVIRLFPTMKDVEKAGTLAETGLGPILKEQPGFRGYYVVRLDQGGAGASISLFDTVENARAAHERSLDWIKENLAPMTGGAAPEVHMGEVLAHVSAGVMAWPARRASTRRRASRSRNRRPLTGPDNAALDLAF